MCTSQSPRGGQQQRFLICTANVRSLRTARRLEDFEQGVTRLDFHIIGLAETRRPKKECISLGSGYTLFNSGRADETPTHAGVGFYMSSLMHRHLIGVRYVSDRVIQAEFLINKRRLRVIQVYAPTSAAPDDDYDQFLAEFELARTKTKKGTTPEIIMGDFNAVIGKTHMTDVTCGNYGFGIRNARGETLLNHCEANGLLVANTFFKKRESRK